MKRFTAETGVTIRTAYGLTESFGPVSAYQERTNGLDLESSDGNHLIHQTKSVMLEEMKVRNAETLQEVPEDGKTLGEIMLRGNVVMKGYLANERATADCFFGGYFRTGDLGEYREGEVARASNVFFLNFLSFILSFILSI